MKYRIQYVYGGAVHFESFNTEAEMLAFADSLKRDPRAIDHIVNGPSYEMIAQSGMRTTGDARKLIERVGRFDHKAA